MESYTYASPSAAPGNKRALTVRKYGPPDTGPQVYIQASLHGDEIPGMLVAHHLESLLASSDAAGQLNATVTVVPYANPIGISQRIHGAVMGRLDLDTGRNFNRYYPDLREAVATRIKGLLTASEEENETTIRAAIAHELDQREPKSEQEWLRCKLMKLAQGADYCIDLHCDTEAVMHMYSGPSRSDDVQVLANLLECQALMIEKVSGGHPFDESLSGVWRHIRQQFPEHPVGEGTMGCTVELRGQGDVSDSVARQDAENLFQFLVEIGVANGTKRDIPFSCEPTPLDGVEYIEAPSAGIIAFSVLPGDVVSKNQTIGTIINPEHIGDASRQEVFSTIDGVVFSRENQRLVAPGQIIMAIAGRESIKGRAGSHLLSD
ncbi:MAG: succinylglutamate desuccinylase/aspartoacylase family protein [Pseudomonadota bacterium]